MDSELITLATASEEANWLRNFLADTPLWERLTLAVLIHCDSDELKSHLFLVHFSVLFSVKIE